jgi:putative oxidoreductase
LVQAGFYLLSALLFHLVPTDPLQTSIVAKNLGHAGGYPLLWASGARAWSLDAWLGPRASEADDRFGNARILFR